MESNGAILRRGLESERMKQLCKSNTGKILQSESVQEMLVQRARMDEKSDEDIGIFFYERSADDPIHISYPVLHANAKHVAKVVRSKGLNTGDRVLLIHSLGPHFLSAFWGCLYAGMVPVPLPPMDLLALKDVVVERFAHVVRAAKASLVLTDSQFHRSYVLAQGKLAVTRDKKRTKLPKIPWVPVDLNANPRRASALPQIVDDEIAKPNSIDDIAYLQFTSGSTSHPKGVMVTHKCVLRYLTNPPIIALETMDREPTNAFSWAPFFHDMGLLVGVIGAVAGYTSKNMHLCSPTTFLKSPKVILEILSKKQIECTVMNNFALDYLVKAVTSTNVNLDREYDLSHMEFFCLGGDFVYPSSLMAFYNTFKVCGLPVHCLQATYGLAEATLGVMTMRQSTTTQFVEVSQEEYTRNEVRILGEHMADTDVQAKEGGLLIAASGAPYPNGNVGIAIVDPETCVVCRHDRVGEIWLRADFVCPGYYMDEEKTRDDFKAHMLDADGNPVDDVEWLRTGDAGFLYEGLLYVTARIKDKIVVRSRNFFPSDIEPDIEKCHRMIRKGNTVVFSITKLEYPLITNKTVPDLKNTDQLIVVVSEVRRREEFVDYANQRFNGSTKPLFTEIFMKILTTLSHVHGITPQVVILVKPRSILKTTSGKKRRRAMKEKYMASGIKCLLEKHFKDKRGAELVDSRKYATVRSKSQDKSSKWTTTKPTAEALAKQIAGSQEGSEAVPDGESGDSLTNSSDAEPFSPAPERACPKGELRVIAESFERENRRLLDSLSILLPQEFSTRETVMEIIEKLHEKTEKHVSNVVEKERSLMEHSVAKSDDAVAEHIIRQKIKHMMTVDSDSDVDLLDVKFSGLGVSSMEFATFAAELQDDLGVYVPAGVLYRLECGRDLLKVLNGEDEAGMDLQADSSAAEKKVPGMKRSSSMVARPVRRSGSKVYVASRVSPSPRRNSPALTSSTGASHGTPPSPQQDAAGPDSPGQERTRSSSRPRSPLAMLRRSNSKNMSGESSPRSTLRRSKSKSSKPSMRRSQTHIST
mmetsp:Transcript_33326/g.93481  ORF Transcript_33326/g.93481 Transcript_33326/m.93481 type:complete len:1038 (+) Transcript_33326:87-3200(+)